MTLECAVSDLLLEKLTFDQLFRISDPKRVARSFTVKGPPLDIDTTQDGTFYIFNFKSNPSTTGLRHKGYVKFLKPRYHKPDQTLQNIDCLVDCTCPDYKFRFSWSNKQRGASRVGPGSLNQALNRAPRKTNPSNTPGLCVAEGELVATEKGSVPIEAVTTQDQVWTLGGWERVIASAKTGIKQVCEVLLKSGLKIRVTKEHPVLAFEPQAGFAWLPAGSLTNKHCLCIALPPDKPAGDAVKFLGVDARQTLSALAEYLGHAKADALFDEVVSVTPLDGLVNVYDLKVENAEHFTVNGVVVHNCKHILAMREYIYGVVSAFPGKEPASAKLDKLTRYATHRWVNFDQLMRQAKDRERVYKERRAARNVIGRLPEPEPVAEPAPEEQPQEPPTATTEPPAPAAPTEPPGPPQAADYPTKAEYDFRRRQGLGDAVVRRLTNFLMERVVSENGMNALTEAKRLVEEMADEMEEVPMDTFPGGGEELETADLDLGEPMEPMEPPVSDAAVGADTEGQTALSLLQSIDAHLAQLLAAVDPAAEEEAAEGELGAVPEEPVEDEIPVEAPPEEGEEFEEEEDVEEFPNARPSE